VHNWDFQTKVVQIKGAKIVQTAALFGVKHIGGKPRRAYILINWVLKKKVVYIKDLKIVPPVALFGANHIKVRVSGMPLP
jgi:hypothetical protein